QQKFVVRLDLRTGFFVDRRVVERDDLFVFRQFQRFDAGAAAQIERLLFQGQTAVRGGQINAAVTRAEGYVAAFAAAAGLAAAGANFVFQGTVAGADV